MRSRSALVAVALLMGAGIAPRVPAGASAADPGGPDFDGDGYADLAVGTAGSEPGGGVHVFYGSATGLTATGDQWFSQDTPGVPGIGEGGDAFGSAVAAGDFDGDGFDDLAIGAPGDAAGGRASGAVVVLRGSGSGLSAGRAQRWHLDLSTVSGRARAGDSFGAALAAGDFDASGEDDLAVGAPGERVGTRGAGAVHVLYGSADGLSASGDDRWHHDVDEVGGSAGDGDSFGSAVAAGDLDGDGFADLAAGAPGDRVTGIGGAGSVTVFPGGVTGLVAAGSERWHQDRVGVPGSVGDYAAFGAAVALGDLDEDGMADLVVGAPGDSPGGLTGAGSVTVLYGSAGLVASAGAQQWTQDSTDVAQVAEAGDGFGAAVAVVDLDVLADAGSYMVVGVPGEALGGKPDAGVGHVLAGSGAGVDASGSLLIAEGIATLPGPAGASERFAASIASGDFDGDGSGDMAIGVPGEEVGGHDRAGALSVFLGWPTPLSGPVGTQRFDEASAGVLGTPGAGDALAAAISP